MSKHIGKVTSETTHRILSTPVELRARLVVEIDDNSGDVLEKYHRAEWSWNSTEWQYTDKKWETPEQAIGDARRACFIDHIVRQHKVKKVS